MKPLQGVRIVSVEQFGAGPYATMLLADLGAEVIKVENAAIGGDPSRKTGPYMLGADDSEYFQAFNINKKSVIASTCKTEEGKAALERAGRDRGRRAQQSARRPARQARPRLQGDARRSTRRSSACTSRPTAATTSAPPGPATTILMQAEAGLMRPDRRARRAAGAPRRPSIIDNMTGLTGSGRAARPPSSRRGRPARAATSIPACSTSRCISSAMPRTWYLNEGARLDAPAAQRALFGRAGADLPDRRRLDLHHVHDREVLGRVRSAAIGRTGSAVRPALSRRQDAAPGQPRRADRDHRWRVAQAAHRVLAGEVQRRAAGRAGLDLAQALDNPFLETPKWSTSSPHPAKPEMRVLANPIRIDGERLGAGALLAARRRQRGLCRQLRSAERAGSS